MEFKFGDIVILNFPFTDNYTFKKRPALILKDTNDGDIIVCRITSKLYETEYDLKLENWKLYGLKSPSVVRVHKIASLESQLAERLIGYIDESVKSDLKQMIAELLIT